jgi:hypothetical protein
MWERDERESGGVEVHPKEESEVRVDEGAATVGPRQFSELGTGMSTSPREPVSGEEPVAGEDEESEPERPPRLLSGRRKGSVYRMSLQDVHRMGRPRHIGLVPQLNRRTPGRFRWGDSCLECSR